MQVICIRDDWWDINNECPPNYPLPEKDNIYTVINKYYQNGHHWYELAEFPPKGRIIYVWLCIYFVPVDDIDISEAIKHLKEQCVEV